MGRLSFEDIAGGVQSTPAPPGAAGIISEAPVQNADGGFSLAKANSFFNEAKELIKSIDDFAGLFIKLRGAQGTGKGAASGFNPSLLAMLPQGEPQDAPAAPVEPVATTDGGKDMPKKKEEAGTLPTEEQLQALLDKIVKGEGDIPLSKLQTGIKNREPWLIKYVLEMISEARPA